MINPDRFYADKFSFMTCEELSKALEQAENDITDRQKSLERAIQNLQYAVGERDAVIAELKERGETVNGACGDD